MIQTFTKTVSIKAVDEEARTATGAVLVADELDHQGDFFRPDAIERFHNPDPDTGVLHSAFPEDAAEMERLEVIDAAETIDGEEFPEGTLVATRRYTDDELFELVADGILTGFSIGGDIADAREHETVPEDVRIPDAVEFGREDGAMELVDGTINEISDVDIPAVPRATYKSTLGKALLDDVDSEAEFVELMTEQRGHEESEARRLYQYLTDVRERSKADGSIGKPFESPQGAEFDDFEDCVETLTDGELEREEAEAVCGAWQEESKNKVEVNGTEVDLTPPDAVVNAVEAAFEAKDETYADEIGDCGTGDGEETGRRILDEDLTAEYVADEIAAYLTSHEDDVAGINQPPTDWGRETWTDGCGPVQYSLWGGTATGTGLAWAQGVANDVARANDDDLPYPNRTMTDKNLDDPEFSEGDAVEWSSNDTTVRGRVADVGDEFTVGGGDVTITGEEGEAVYLIHELDDSLEPPQYRRENVAKPESSLDESQADLPPATDDNFEETMTATDTDGIDDATKLQVIKSWLTGSDDSDASGEALGETKATDEDEEDEEDDEEDEDEEEEMAADDDKHTNMTDDTQSDPPEWAKSLTDTVEQIDERVSALESDGDGEADKMADAPEWAQDLAEKVDGLDDRVDAITKQSGHSQQLDATETDSNTADEVEQFKKGLVGAGGD